MGLFHADDDSDTTDFDTDAFYLNAAVGRQNGTFTLEAGLGLAWLSADRERQNLGSSDAKADYDCTLFAASMGVKRAFDISSDTKLL